MAAIHRIIDGFVLATLLQLVLLALWWRMGGHC
jgi:hypothetical protein